VTHLEVPPKDEAYQADGRDFKRMIVALSMLVICLGYWCCVPVNSKFEMIDHHVFLRATELMRGGLGYYPAMDRSLREVYGPAESSRAFRLPTLFLCWSRLPSPSWIWAAYVAMVAITGLVVLNLTEVPVMALVVVIYLLNNATVRHEGTWFAQFTTTELWAVPFIAATLLAWRQDLHRMAAFFALLAALVRETTAGLLLGGLAAAYSGRRPLWPWLVAAGVAGAAFVAHTKSVSPYLVPRGEGRETPLLGTGGPLIVLRMAGFGLPAGEVLGLALWLLSLGFILWHGRSERPAIVHLSLPLAGLLADRPYWGLLVVPFTLLTGSDAVRALLVRQGRDVGN
jgi:hypothetical protein